MNLGDNCNCKEGYQYDNITKDCECEDGTFKDSNGNCQSKYKYYILIFLY